MANFELRQESKRPDIHFLRPNPYFQGMKVMKQIGWLMVELLCFVVCFLAFVLIVSYVLKATGVKTFEGLPLDESANPFRLLLDTGFIFVFLGGFLVSALVYHVIFRRPFNDLGYIWASFISQFGMGWWWSVLLIIPGFLVIWMLGQLDMQPLNWKAGMFFGFLIFFFIQSTAEEMITRSYLIPTVESRLGSWPALILSGSIFAIMHIGNDHFNWVGFINILLGGIIMALLFILFRNVWICAGMHAGWNFLQGTLLDFNVSGADVYSLVQFQDVGYARISGAQFGYEGSLIAVLVQMIALVYILKKYKIEMKPFPKPSLASLLPSNFEENEIKPESPPNNPSSKTEVEEVPDQKSTQNEASSATN